ncbi:3-methyladenine DNA glycosylase AlkD [Kineosphaera limosa]|nr:DNA alkylation repair protein [Kineosphaera limosa]NYE00260.1 3-methyladenine DNA glycosylase AlkD [Kineosphaera limosa]
MSTDDARTGEPLRRDVRARRDAIEAIRATLQAEADADRGAQQQRYMKSSMPFYGLPMPLLRRRLKPILRDPALLPADRDEWEATVRALWDEAGHREERYAAIELAGVRAARDWQDPQTRPLYEHLIRTGAWWDFVDAIASGLIGPIVRAYPAEADQMREWAHADDLWVRRTAIICQLGSGPATDLDLLEDAIDANVEGTPFGSEFFIRKAIGWALRQHARIDPGWVRAAVDGRRDVLSGLSIREATKHLADASS